MSAVKNSLRKLRAQYRISRPVLGRLVGVSDTTVQNWELGRYEPRFSDVCRLARVFGVTIEDLCDKDIAEDVLPSDGTTAEPQTTPSA